MSAGRPALSGPALSGPGALLRRHDPDRFRFALFAPHRHREAVFALYAFNHEIARIRGNVSEPMIGAIRLQWWREAMDGIYAGTPRRHEVVRPLADAIMANSLPRAPFDALIEARMRDLEDRAMDDLAEAEHYLRATTAPLAALLAAVLDPDEMADRAALADIAAAHGMLGKLRAAAHDEAARRPFFPRPLLEKHGGSGRVFSELGAGTGERAATREMVERAVLLAKDGLARTVKYRALAPLLLPACQVKARARQLGKLGHNPFAEAFGRSDPFDIWRFCFAFLTRLY